MLTVEINQQSLRQLQTAIRKVGGNLDREMATAINKTAKRTKRLVAKRVTSRLNAVQKVVIENMPKPSKANPSKLSSTVELKQSRRLGLHKLKNTRHGKKGVAYRIDKRAARQTIRGAFMGPRPGRMAARLKGLVAMRVGATRKPLRFPQGASPWGIFVVNKMSNQLVPEAEQLLETEIKRRVRTVLVRGGLIG